MNQGHKTTQKLEEHISESLYNWNVRKKYDHKITQLKPRHK